MWLWSRDRFWAIVCKTVRPMLSDRCLSVLSVCLSVCPVITVCPVCNVGVLWPNGWMDQDETWHAGRPRPWPRCVRRGPSSPSLKSGQSSPPQLSDHVYCGQTAGWIKMALGMDVGLGPGHIVLDGDPNPPPKKGAQPTAPIFSPFLVCPNCWMHQDATSYGGRTRPRPYYDRWALNSPPQKGGGALPNFRHMSIMARRLDGSRCYNMASWR